MFKRQSVLGLIISSSFLVCAPAAEAQREGFIIGGGVGPGMVKQSGGDFGSTDGALAMEFHIGGVLNGGVFNDVEVYFVSYFVVWGDFNGTSSVRGLRGLGVAKLVRPRVTLNGALGWSIEGDSRSDSEDIEVEGIALGVGGRYNLDESGRWVAALNIWHARPGDGVTRTGVALTINVMSH